MKKFGMDNMHSWGSGKRQQLSDEMVKAVAMLSGEDVTDVAVFYQSPEPLRLGIKAFALNNTIYLSPGYEETLGHEVWHIVQQRQGRVASSCLLDGLAINNDAHLEHEADVVGELLISLSRAIACGHLPGLNIEQRVPVVNLRRSQSNVLQAWGLEDIQQWASKLCCSEPDDPEPEVILGGLKGGQKLQGGQKVVRISPKELEEDLDIELDFDEDNEGQQAGPQGVGKKVAPKELEEDLDIELDEETNEIGELSKSFIEEEENRVDQKKYKPRQLDPALDFYLTAAVRYIVAIRGKEELRSFFGKNKLKDVKQKTLSTAATALIESVRTEKKAARAKYKKALKLLLKMRKERKRIVKKNQQLIEKLQQMDDFSDSVDKLITGLEKLKDINKVIAQLKEFEQRYGINMRKVTSLAQADIASNGKSFGVGVSITINIGISKAKLGGGITYSANTNITDDRRLRVSSSWEASGKASAEMAQVLSAELGVSVTAKTVEVFIDGEHWAATFASRVAKLRRAFKKKGMELEADMEMYFDDDAGTLFQNHNLAVVTPITYVDAEEGKASFKAEAFKVGVEVARSETTMNFRKENKVTSGEQVVSEFGLKLGSNISFVFAYTTIDNHANCDNDGRYINLKLVLTGSAKTGFSSKSPDAQEAQAFVWEKSLREAMGFPAEASSSDPTFELGNTAGTISNDTVDNIGVFDKLEKGDTKHWGKIIQELATSLNAVNLGVKIEQTSDLGKLTGSEIEIVKKGACIIEWNFVRVDTDNDPSHKQKHWRLQYRRYSKSSEMSGGITVPVYDLYGVVELGVDVNASKNTSMMISEYVASNTLTYLQTVYDGLRLRDERDQKLMRNLGKELRTEAYIKKHRLQVWRMLRALSKSQRYSNDSANAKKVSGIWMEVRNDIVLKDDDAAVMKICAQELLQACHDLIDPATDKNLDDNKFTQLLPPLLQYLESRKLYYYAERASIWKQGNGKYIAVKPVFIQPKTKESVLNAPSLQSSYDWTSWNARANQIAGQLGKSLYNNSGHANNCLIYALANAAGNDNSPELDGLVVNVRQLINQGYGTQLYATETNVKNIATEFNKLIAGKNTYRPIHGRVTIHNCYSGIEPPQNIVIDANAGDLHILHRVNHYMALR